MVLKYEYTVLEPKYKYTILVLKRKHKHTENTRV